MRKRGELVEARWFLLYVRSAYRYAKWYACHTVKVVHRLVAKVQTLELVPLIVLQDKELLGYDLDPSGALRPRPPWRFDCGIEEEIELVSEEFADELPATEVRTMCSILGISHLLPVEKRGRGRKKARKHEVENWNECAFAGVA